MRPACFRFMYDIVQSTPPPTLHNQKRAKLYSVKSSCGLEFIRLIYQGYQEYSANTECLKKLRKNQTRSVVSLVRATSTVRKSESARKRSGIRGAMRRRENKGDCRKKHVVVKKGPLLSPKQFLTFCLKVKP